MSDYVLDASAVLALLNQEPGADLVQDALPHAVISTVNLAEIVTRLTAKGMPEAEIRDVLSLLGVESVPFDEESAIQSGLLYAGTHTAGLSSGDRACLTLAKNLNTIAFTADRAWQGLDIGVQVRLIR
ncbi:MAG: type II toxin-antitoxin system VapC family toxin [Anaerolineales bacterium]|jgi:ribonuclease VapC